MRGYLGANGGNGVITRAAIRLSPWFGPPEIESRGHAPNFEVVVPDAIKTYTLTWDTNDGLIEAFRLIAEEGIAYALRSAELLSEAFGQGDPQVYEHLWRAQYGSGFLAASGMLRPVDLNVGAYEIVFQVAMAMALSDADLFQ